MKKKNTNKAIRSGAAVLMAALLIVMLTGTFALPVQAADLEYTCRINVNEYSSYILYSETGDVITDISVVSGSVPGMDLGGSGTAALVLAGTPTTAGTHEMEVSLTTQNKGTVSVKITVTVAEPIPTAPSADGTPKVTKHPSGEEVVEGESATFIAYADNTLQYIWSIALADAVIDCVDLPSYLGGNVKVSGYNSHTLVISNIPVELDGAYVRCRFVGAEESVNSDSAKITVTAQKDAKPVVTKDPTDETVDEGGRAVFVAIAKYAQKYQWKMVSPNGVTTDCADATKTFKELKITGVDAETLILENIPAELDGYRFYCNFIGGEETSGNAAKLSVNAAAEETEPPTVVSTEAPAEDPVDTPENVPAEDPNQDAPEQEDKPVREDPEDEADGKEQDEPEQEEGQQDNRRRKTGLIITAVIALVAIGVGGAAGYVIWKMNRPSRRKRR